MFFFIAIKSTEREVEGKFRLVKILFVYNQGGLRVKNAKNCT